MSSSRPSRHPRPPSLCAVRSPHGKDLTERERVQPRCGLRASTKRRREIERALGVLEDPGRLRRETRQAERGGAADVWAVLLP